MGLIAVVILTLIHLFAGTLQFLGGTPRSVWLSAAGGVSVSYIFVHLLPEMNDSQSALEVTLTGTLAQLEHHIYLLMLAGLVIFYGLERAAVASHTRHGAIEGEEAASHNIFWVHMATFAAYNALIGYLIFHYSEVQGIRALFQFAFAMALHFVVNDFGLREHFESDYHRIGRWVLSASVLLGWLVGVTWDVPETALSVVLAFLAGGIILNVLKEELPEKRESRFWAFLVGAAGYALLLLAI